jgi:formylglycine-generating enzyme required for sulfatase activity
MLDGGGLAGGIALAHGSRKHTASLGIGRCRSSLVLTVALGLSGLGCEDEPIGGKAAGPGSGPGGERGPEVAIQGQGVQVGFALGHMRKSVELDSFRISRHPVTRAQYGACVAAGRCAAPPPNSCADLAEMPIWRRPNFNREDLPDDVAVTCTGLQGARQYCGWVGGRLPTFEQWLLAARGSSPQRFPWGDRLPICEQHPLGRPKERTPAARCPLSREDAGRVGLHTASASVFGVEDILLTRAELVEASPEGLFPACRADSKSRSDTACVVSGIDPGSIDSVQRVALESARPGMVALPYGFRCAWGGAS